MLLIMPLRPRQQKRVRNKKELIDIWTNSFTDDMITTDLNNTNKKIMALIEQLPEEVRIMIKAHTLEQLQKKSFLLFLVAHLQGACLDKLF